MRRSLRRQLAFFRIYTIVSSLALIGLGTAAFTQSTQKFGHISAERWVAVPRTDERRQADDRRAAAVLIAVALAAFDIVRRRIQ